MFRYKAQQYLTDEMDELLKKEVLKTTDAEIQIYHTCLINIPNTTILSVVD